MTIPDIVTFINTAGVLGILAVYIAGTYYRKLMWVYQHEEVVKLLEQRFADLERHSKEIEDDLRHQLAAAIKRGDEWQDMAWQQKRTVDKSLEVVTVSAEKSTK
jgi:hypothetical protein